MVLEKTFQLSEISPSRGNVNIGGFMEYLVLQNTRLSIVMKLAETITSAIQLATTQED
jgi:putative sporulation protein YyaC